MDKASDEWRLHGPADRSGAGTIAGDAGAFCSRWFAVYTKPRQEHTALLNLQGQSFECYLPMTDEPRQRRARSRATPDNPLFPRYLFLYAAPEIQSLATVRSTRGVVGLVRAGLELISIPAAVIAELKSRMHPSTGLIAVNGIPLANGETVRVVDGPFSALEGIFKEHRGRARSLMLLELLGREIEVDINTRLLQRAD